jgi:NhaA family Na+:H+ antiporter
LPAIGALGGMVVPALIYYFINIDNPENLSGWAIPAATDIAFALGVLALLGSKAPVSLKILLTAIAVIDDIGAILIIAVFYSHGFVLEPLYFAVAALIGLFILNVRGVTSISPYILIGIILWIAVLKSGVHATLAGVITAFFIPDICPPGKDKSPCRDMVHSLHPWVAFGILPVFALANAGVPFSGMGLHSFAEPVTLGIMLGLLLGKPLGIFTFLFLTIKTGLSPMPARSGWLHLFAISVLCGIGFTMSLFIGGLAFQGIEMQASVRLGVLGGSIVAAIVGYMILRFAPLSSRAPE